MQRIFLSPPDISGNEQLYVQEAFASNYVAPVGPMLERFEAAMQDYTGIAHCVALSSGTAALHLALTIMGIQAGDNVWAPSFTFIGGVAPAAQVGSRLTFIDSEPEFWTIDPQILARNLAQAQQAGTLPKALITTDIYGQSVDYQAIRALCDQYGIFLIADSAEAIGSLYQGAHVGNLADITIFSFNGNKIITSSGGGILATHRSDWANRARKLATQAREPVLHYEHHELGYNYRLSNICAAIGLAQLEQIEDKVAARQAILARYREALSDIPGIAFLQERPGTRMNSWLSMMTINPNRIPLTPEALCAQLDAENIEARPAWKPMHMQPVFNGIPMQTNSQPALCEQIFAQGICLPSGSGMRQKEQDRVIHCIQKALRHG